MSIFLREPNPGDRISANLIRDIIRAIKAIRPIAGHGMKLKRGPNGTTFNATVPQPASGSASQVGHGCWSIVSIEAPEDENEENGNPQGKEFTVTFENPYFRIGGITHSAGRVISVTFPCVIYLKIDMTKEKPGAELKSVEELGEMLDDERDTDNYVLPLYAFDGNSRVVTDFRAMPSAAAFEFDAGQTSGQDEEVDE